MAYPPPQGGGYPPYGAPPSHSPQPGYQQPPPGQYPSQGYPPQHAAPPGPPQGYGQSQGYYQQPQGYQQQHQQPYGAPPQGPPSHQQPYGIPPQGQYPPHQSYGAPSPYPPQQSYGAPSSQPPQQYHGGAPPGPPGQYGVAPYPVQQPQQQQPPYGGAPQAPYGAAPPQPYGAPPVQPTPPSPGYAPNQMIQFDASGQADVLRKAMKGFGTDEASLIRVLAHMGPLEILVLKQTYQQRHHRSLEGDIDSETSSYFKMTLLSILRGPLQQDVWCLQNALRGAGTKESVLNDVLIGRSNADMNAIKHAYQQTYHRSLESDVRGDLSAKTERLFSMILAASRQEESAPVIPQQVDADVTELHRATEGKVGTEQLTVCSILSNRSNGHIRAISNAYEHKYRIPLEKVIEKEFSGHMEDALIQMITVGTDRAMRDARLLEDSMRGPGTKDEMLVRRMVAIHWNRNHMAQVKGAYKVKYNRDLASRIRGETSGSYEKILLALME